GRPRASTALAWAGRGALSRCSRPSTDRLLSIVPITRRGRVSGLASERMSATATTSNTSGTATEPAPNTLRIPMVTTSPTGPALSHSTPTAVISARAISPSARPSLRCSGSRSRVLPTALASPPTPLAARFHPPRTAEPAAPEPFPPRRADCADPVDLRGGVRDDDAARVRDDEARLAPPAPEPLRARVLPDFAPLPDPPDFADPDLPAAPPRPFVTDPLAMSPR